MIDTTELEAAIKELGTVEFMHQPHRFRRGILTVTLGCSAGFLAKAYAETILHTIELLDASAEVSKPGSSKEIEWQVIEAGIIGDRAMFTLAGVSKAAVEAHLAKLAAEKKEG
jgi:diaminopimelate epimerase